MVGSCSSRASAHPDAPNCRGVFGKTLTVLLAIALAFSLTPTAAWAQEGADASDAAPAASAGKTSEDVQAEASESAPSGSAEPQPEAEAGQSGAPAAGEAATSEGDGPASSALSVPESAASAPADPAASAFAAPAALPAYAPAANSYVFIQDTQDEDGTSKASGALETGAVLWANLHDYGSDDAIAHEDAWSYQWLASPKKSSSASDYQPIEGQTSQNLTITDELAEQLAGSYLAVRITVADHDYYGPGYSGISSFYVPGPVMKPGAVQLSGVELEKPASLELGTTLRAKAYKGTSYAPTYVTEGVAYTWKYAETSNPSSYTSWTTIEGATGPTFTVSDEFYLGKCIAVSAEAGANTVDFGYPYGYGPFRLKGAVDIYAVSFAGGNAYAAGETITVQAKEKGAASGEFIDPEKLTYQWLASTDASSFDPVPGATGAALTLDEGFVGKYVKCVVSAKVGTSTYTSRPTLKVAAAGSINVTSVLLDKSGKLYVGDTVTATAKASSGGATVDVTGDPKIAWSWYCGDSSSAIDRKIEGATGNTLAVDDALLGKYVEARADGGFGEADSSAIGPVVKAGAVSLYKVEASGSGRVGSTVTATAYDTSSSEASDKAVIDYQWQYATSNTTSDSAFKDIPGATGKAYAVPETIDGMSSLGLYLRVKASSDGTVVSTYQKSYYGPKSVDPLGPIMLDGAYELSSVKLESSGQGMQSGNVITPKAKVKSGFTEKDAPADAKVTYTWQVRDGASDAFERLTEGVSADGTLTLTDALVGKQVKVSASALVEGNEPASTAYTVLAAGTYDLLRATISPSSGTLFTGDTVTAAIQARSLNNVSIGDNVTDKVALSWSVSDTADGTFVPLEGAHAAQLVIPSEAAGKYLKVTAASASSVEAVTVGAVVDSDSLSAAAQKLDKASFRPLPVYGESANVNELVKAKLAELGYDGVDVATKTVAANTSSEPKAQVGVSTAPDDTNGDVTFFFLDPDEKTSFVDYSRLKQVGLTFELSRNGETFDTANVYEPNVTIPWDDAKVADLLNRKAADLALGFASDDTASSVTGNLTLPNKVADRSWSSVSWASSDASAIRVSGSSWESSSTGKVTRFAADRTVTLTATVGIGTSGGPDTTVEKAFEVTVKSDPEKVASERAALQKKVDEGFAEAALKDAETDAAVDAAAIAGDLTLPSPRTLGVDGKYYRVAYSSSTDAVVLNGYAAKVYQPLAGQGSVSTDLTVTVTDKSNSEISATKSMRLTVAPMEQSAIDREVELMDTAKAAYASAILNGQDAGAVTQGLRAFQKATFDADGQLAWSYDIDSAKAAGDGIVPVELEGYDPMSSAGWRLFRSSNPAVVKHENLLVSQPEYNTKVTVESCLASQKYARYAERYPDNQQFQKLANQNVSAALTVTGASGQEDPQVVATCSVIGMDKDGNRQTWAAAEPFTLENGAKASDLSEALFAKAGIAATIDRSWGWYITDMTSPFDADQKLGWDQATGRFWQLFINGTAPETFGAGDYVLQAGDSVVWYYSASGDPAPTDQLSVTCSVVGTAADGTAQVWASETPFAMAEGSTAADLSDQAFSQSGLVAVTGTGEYGWYLSSIASPYDDRVLSTKETSPGVYAYWQLFVNGEYSQKGAGDCTLQAGDSVVWLYGSSGTLPDGGDVVIEPDAPRPDYGSDWAGYAGGAATDAPTPTGAGEEAWAVEMENGGYASDLLIVNDDLYMASSDALYVKDRATGKTKLQGRLAGKIGYLCRLAYADGLVIVPLGDGRLQALTADTLKTVWLTESLSSQQALSTLTVEGSCVYYGTADATWSSTRSGFFLCIDLATGKTLWKFENQTKGFYWSGAAFAQGFMLVAGDDGLLRSFDAATGAQAASLDLGSPVRSTVVMDESGTAAFVVSTDGVLHKVSVAPDGALGKVADVKFGSYSTGTPTVANGKVVLCGQSLESYENDWGYPAYYGEVAVVDAQTMALEQRVIKTDDGRYLPAESKSAPVVSVQGDQIYAYFTCNEYPGGVYRYRVGDESAQLFYTPADDAQNYCTASVIAGPDGTLYYSNDSHTLFAIKGSGKVRVVFDAQGGTKVAAGYADPGSPVARPADPTREGFVFAGWYADAACTAAWDFASPVTGSLVLYAKWDKKPGPSPDNGGSEGGSGGEPDRKGSGAGGFVPASATPISPKADTKKAGVKAEGKDGTSAQGAAAGHEQRAVYDGIDGAESGSTETPLGVNPWAAGGIAVGVVGLGGAAAVTLRARGRNGGKAR